MKISGQVIEKINRTQRVISIRIENSDVKFKAGQFFKLYSNNEFRYLSVSCSPKRNYLEFTKRITESEFSSWFKSLEIGHRIIAEGPYGKFVMEEENKILFIAGGMGITPILGLIDDAFLTSSKKDFVLFYGNRSCDDIPFYDELNHYSGSIKLKLFIFTEEKKEGFYYGLIDLKKIFELLPDATERTAFVCGPPGMVETITKQIRKSNFTDGLKTEKIIGYQEEI